MLKHLFLITLLSLPPSSILADDDWDDEDAWIDGDMAVTGFAKRIEVEVPATEIDNNVAPVNLPNTEKPASCQEPGAMGAPYVIKDPTPEQEKLIEEGYKRHAFNEYVSDLIPVRRSLPDYRNYWCKKPGLYAESLLPASVILCFHNEAYSVLLRSIHSILDTTPEHLLTEIVLVDDSSNFGTRNYF